MAHPQKKKDCCKSDFKKCCGPKKKANDDHKPAPDAKKDGEKCCKGKKCGPKSP